MTRHLSEAERRAQILRSARAVFVERGYLSARMEDVARRARLSKGAVYFYFKSKRELFDALVEEEEAVTLGLLEGISGDLRPAPARLIALGLRYLDYFAGLKTPPRFFMLMNEMAIRDELIRGRITALHNTFLERLSALLAEGASEGTIRDLDPLAVAMLLKAMVDGLAGQSAVGLRPDVRRLTTDGVRLVLEGLATGALPMEKAS